MNGSATTSKKTQSLWSQRAFLLLLPVVLAMSAWELRQLQKPIEVEIPSPGLWKDKDGGFSVRKQKISVFHQLVVRLIAESQKHPFASSITISQVTPWPKESGLNLYFSETLEWNRKTQTLGYVTSNYGWIYSHVEKFGIEILAKAHLKENPITLPNAVNAQLRSYGWTLTEYSSP